MGSIFQKLNLKHNEDHRHNQFPAYYDTASESQSSCSQQLHHQIPTTSHHQIIDNNNEVDELTHTVNVSRRAITKHHVGVQRRNSKGFKMERRLRANRGFLDGLG